MAVTLRRHTPPGPSHSRSVRPITDAPLQLIEYGDYECPYCGLAAPGVKDLIERHSPHLVFAWRHFPLVSQHPHAWDAALAAEAAGRQGRFWEMHGRLLSHQRKLAPDDLAGHAARARPGPRGLPARYGGRGDRRPRPPRRPRSDALRRPRHSDFYVNGRMIEGGYHEQEIESALVAELHRGADPAQR